MRRPPGEGHPIPCSCVFQSRNRADQELDGTTCAGLPGLRGGPHWPPQQNYPCVTCTARLRPTGQFQALPIRRRVFQQRWLVSLVILLVAFVRCSNPAPSARELARPPGGREREQVACLMLARRSVTSTVAALLGVEGGGSTGRKGAAECAGDFTSVRAGEDVVVYSHERVEWTAVATNPDTAVGEATASDAAALPGFRGEEESSLRGRFSGGGPALLAITVSGTYHVLVRPASHGSLAPPFRLRMVVTSGYSFAPASRACYVRPFEPPNVTYTGGEEEECYLQNSSEPLFLQKDVRPVISPEEQAAKEAAAAAAANSTNGTAAPTQVVKPFEMCYYRNCLTVRVRRFDRWSNAVRDPGIVDTVSVELMGQTPSRLVSGAALAWLDYEDHTKRVYSSTGSTRTYETYQIPDPEPGEPLLAAVGNTTCNTFVCDQTKLVAPNDNFMTWVVVRLSGVPVGLGSPILAGTAATGM
jgi:hypothetical protein